MLSLDSIFADFRQAVRGLWRDKLFTAAVLATFALCVAVNVVVFSVVHAVLLQPPGWPKPDELVTMVNRYSKFGGGEGGAASVPNYYERRNVIAAFSEVAAMRGTTALVGKTDTPARVSISLVTPSFFRALGVHAALGRVFLEDEGTEGHANVVVLSDGWWHERYHADRDVVGRTLELDGQPTTIVGVMPRDFHYFSERTNLWRPLVFSAAERDPNNRHLNTVQLIARLRPGASLAQAQAEIDALNVHLAATDINDAWAKASGFSAPVLGLVAHRVAGVRPALLLLAVGVWLLLLVGMVNVQNLLLVRATARAKEFAVRQVMGATRRTIALRFIAETALLGLLGGLIGLGVAMDVLPELSRLDLYRLTLGADIRITLAMALNVVGVSLGLGALLAIPLIVFTRSTRLASALSGESRGGTASRSTLKLRNALIVAQIALAFVLLTCAALLGESFRKVLAVNSGFRPQNVICTGVGLTPKRYQDSASRFRFSNRWLDSLDALPGVESAALSTALPMDSGGIWFQAVMVEGHTPKEGEQPRPHNVIGVEGDYFSTLGVPLLAGRYFMSSDSLAAQRVCVVDEAFARRYWPNGSALGHRVAQPGNYDPFAMDAMTIVGVVGNVKQSGLTEKVPSGTLYFSLRPDATQTWLVTLVRTTQIAEGSVSAMRKALQRLDPELPLEYVKTLAQRVDESSRYERSLMLLSSLFAGMALLLAAVGVYGVMGYTVAQKQREVGIRMALGALPSDILRQFLGLGGRLLLAGTLAGAIGAWFAAGALRGLLFGISPTTPMAFVGTALVLGAITMLACVVPSRRAAAVSMTESLKRE